MLPTNWDWVFNATLRRPIHQERAREVCTTKMLKIKGNVQLKEVTEGLSLWHFKPRQGTTYQIFVPKILQIPLVEWYHETLKYAGTSQTKDTICQNYAWPNATITINEVVRKWCCQMNKITGQRNYTSFSSPLRETTLGSIYTSTWWVHGRLR